ncbi:hypothetical protein K3495_g8701 [Podosphaera aphanis]|nr:hypothetical protein K3495_g8701 [Podosphaera aphanis]
MEIFSLLSTLLLRAIGISPQAPNPNPSISPQQANSMYQVAAHYQSTSYDFVNDTENGLSGSCKAVTMIFAKGTGESGNVGDGRSPGPVWIEEMRSSIGEANIAVQGVDYSASIFGYLVGGDPKGSARFLELTNKAAIKCPKTKIILGGYSQGAQLAHNAALKFSETVMARVSAVVLFGDPFYPISVGNVPSSQVLNICHKTDIICKGKGGISDHLTYGNDSPLATAFAFTRIQLKSRYKNGARSKT